MYNFNQWCRLEESRDQYETTMLDMEQVERLEGIDEGRIYKSIKYINLYEDYKQDSDLIALIKSFPTYKESSRSTDIRKREDKETGVSVEYLPPREREWSTVHQITNAVMGDERKEEFHVRFNPVKIRGNTLEERQREFTQFLQRWFIKHLWVIRWNGETVGFLLVMDTPGNDRISKNAVGFSIGVDYTGKGIMTKAFQLIRESGLLSYPLYGYTSERNAGSQKLMLKLGFKESGRFTVHGEPTIGYVLDDK